MQSLHHEHGSRSMFLRFILTAPPRPYSPCSISTTTFTAATTAYATSSEEEDDDESILYYAWKVGIITKYLTWTSSVSQWCIGTYDDWWAIAILVGGTAGDILRYNPAAAMPAFLTWVLEILKKRGSPYLRTEQAKVHTLRFIRFCIHHWFQLLPRALF